MITLGELRARVTARLAEDSPAFWSVDDRNRAINDAQKLIAAVTKGVEVAVEATDSASVTFSRWGSAGVRHAYAIYGNWVLPAVTIEEANLTDRKWRTPSDYPPHWVVVDERTSTASLAYPPRQPRAWTFFARVTPPDAESDATELFLGSGAMDKFLNATVLLACAYLLLQERFDGDAERFYNLALQELVILGVDSAQVPTLQGGLGGVSGA